MLKKIWEICVDGVLIVLWALAVFLCGLGDILSYLGDSLERKVEKWKLGK